MTKVFDIGDRFIDENCIEYHCEKPVDLYLVNNIIGGLLYCNKIGKLTVNGEIISQSDNDILIINPKNHKLNAVKLS